MADKHDFSTGLRALADFLDAHPERKRDHDSLTHNIVLSTIEDVRAFADTVGGVREVHPASDGQIHDGVRHVLGNGVSLFVFTVRTFDLAMLVAAIHDPAVVT